MSTPSPASARLQGRILGIDVARALAIVGMLAVHVGPTDAQGVLGRLYALPHGRASVLFVVVAGVGVTLLASSRRRALSDVRRELAWRSAVLLAAGLALQSLDHGVLVILQTYAPLFLVGAFAVGWSDVALLVAAAAMSLAGPALFVAGHALAPARYDRAAVRLTDGVAEIAHGIVLSGAYPLVVWVAPLLFGMWLGRRDLGTRATQLALVASGAVVAVGAWLLPRGARVAFGADALQGWGRVLDATPHAQTPAWLWTAAGSAAFVLGASLLAARAWPRATWSLAATGQVALTVYVGHLLALHVWSDMLRADTVAGGAASLVALTVLAATVASAWRRRWQRGPLEAVLRWPTGGGAAPTRRR
ncbi:MAG: DUF418 domain-containing protein [Trueperaceae bacterium]|nr:DUF418 domain-containing protein [Trueperaceae bacterium]